LLKISRKPGFDLPISIPYSLVRYVATFRCVDGEANNATDAGEHVLCFASINNELFLYLR